MKQQTTDDLENQNHKFVHVVLVGVILTVCGFIGLSASSFDGPVTQMTSTHADPAWPIEPADLQVAERYGHFDYSSLNSPAMRLESNPSQGATIAAYESQPE